MKWIVAPIILIIPALLLGSSFIEKTEPIEESFLRSVKPLNQGVSFSKDCGFFKEQERLCVFYDGSQIGPPGFLFRKPLDKKMVRWCEAYGLSTYYYRDACGNPWDVIQEYQNGYLGRDEFVDEYRIFTRCLSRGLDGYRKLEFPAAAEQLKQRYIGQLADMKYYNLCLLNFARTGNYSFIYGKLKKRFAKRSPAKFERAIAVLKDGSKSQAQQIYAFYPKFFVEFVNLHGAKADADFEKLLKKKGIDFWD